MALGISRSQAGAWERIPRGSASAILLEAEPPEYVSTQSMGTRMESAQADFVIAATDCRRASSSNYEHRQVFYGSRPSTIRYHYPRRITVT